MSERKRFILVHDTARKNAITAVRDAPDGYYVEVKPATRSIEQNAKMWSMLSEIANQVEWHGEFLSSDDWKHIFSASLRGQKAVPGLDGGFVVLGQHTSKMTKSEMADLITLMYAFGAERDVTFAS